MQYVLPNKLLWYIAIANVFCLSAALRQSRLVADLPESAKHFALDKLSPAYSRMNTRVFRHAAVCGWMSDKVFRGNRRDRRDFMTPVTIGHHRLLMNPAGNPNVDMACKDIGFLIHGPVMLTVRMR